MKLLPSDIENIRTDRQPDTAECDSPEVPRHVFDRKSIQAVNGAIAAERPLLVRGEPGVGKTQLARAVAAALECPLVPYTVNNRTEASDLLWTLDAIRRLSEAQLCAASQGIADAEEIRIRMNERRFVRPGPLWWGFNWETAQAQLQFSTADVRTSGDSAPSDDAQTDISAGQPDDGGDPKNGVVVLIDEIDKADSDIPNGLLEAFGSRQFSPVACDRVTLSGHMPLVIITTNQERVLPDAFLRRCLVLHMKPYTKSQLVERGVARFGEGHRDLVQSAATQLIRDREDSPPPRPGLAEYLDLIRAVLKLACEQQRDPIDIMHELEEFILRKHSGGA